ncbi:hypothetical protein CTI12_AA028060 [Artemisia annua]|uniref:Uncharacterized protein n=1 Tax=Artemisia annua TaxID=35608 RepID=A0A2U1Q0J4_ARTAN|nr:hypothetical protein CTI12_AA028060 [Artemisia annua]
MPQKKPFLGIDVGKLDATKEKITKEAVAILNPFDTLDMTDTDDNGISCATSVSPKDGADLKSGSKKETKVAEEDSDDEVLDCQNDMASFLASGIPAVASSSKGGYGGGGRRVY